ncbi:MAG: hypothetical protein QXG39_09105 [Candidatus Aenigmatarchaeota archaeon]
MLGYISGGAVCCSYEGLRDLIAAMVGIMFFGFVVGYKIGKYVEEVYFKRKFKDNK